MAYKSLRHFADILEQNGELIRVKRFVDPVMEITEITDRYSKLPGGGKALLFENTGTDFPVLTNALGSEKRICLALGTNNLEALRDDVGKLLEQLTRPRGSFWSKLSALPELARVASWMPASRIGKGVCQQVVHYNPHLDMLPVLKCWPHDGGRFITLPMVHTVDPNTGARNVGMYRMQIFDSSHTGMHWQKHKTGAKHFEEYKRLGKLMPIAVTLGGDPAYTYAATAPMPENVDEYILAGFLRKKRVKLVKCLTVDIEVPEDVDFVIEGYVAPSEEPAWEGPFGDHTGFYSLADWYPRFKVTCITHRADAVYPATIVGVPPMEDAYIAKATERIFLEPIRRTLLPELTDMLLPTEGVAHNIALVKIKDEFQGQAYRVMSALWGAGQMMFNKVLVAFPDKINLTDGYQMLNHICRTVNPQADLFFGKGPLDVLDHSSNQFAFGSKLFIDATSLSFKETGFNHSVDDVKSSTLAFSNHIVALNLTLLEKDIPILIVSVKKKEIEDWQLFRQELSSLPIYQGLFALVLVDLDNQIDDLSLVLWFLLGNIDPSRDILIIRGNESNLILVDGTRKAYPTDNFPRHWPNIVTMDAETIEKVDQMWHWLNIGEFIESPSLKLINLNQTDDAVMRIQ
ncbi:MAG TPA: menaquinone biosynthesis decarboxylase [Bacteroidales bacterium]|nr:menaquinone biosynthesis decarboxylase [Bacteroidales bacterium]